MSKRIDLAGQRFGKLVVIEYERTGKSPRYEAYWKCLCDCGKETIVTSGHLKSEHTQSCGCWHKEKLLESNLGNTKGRKYENPKMTSARVVWSVSYSDGCPLETFLELSQNSCNYCGIEPSNSFNKYLTKTGKIQNGVSPEWAEQANFTYNGLDRIDPEKDHSEDNIVPSCFPCNRAKDDRTFDEFKKWIIRIVKHFIKKKLISFEDLID